MIDKRPHRHRHRFARRSLAPAWLAALALVGCGGEPADTLPRRPIEGVVTLGGKPVEVATIQFLPGDPGQEAVLGFAEVRQGKFAIDRAKGLVPGTYRVVISSVPPAAPMDPNAEPGKPSKRPKETIPAKYNEQTTLTVKVSPEGPNQFEFPLTP